MRELNIRAAKCLGCDYMMGGWANTERYWMVFSDWVPDTRLRFTTSYDWAVLGFKKVLKTISHGNLDYQRAEMFELVGRSRRKYKLRTPKQITLAWVEFLEENSTEEKEE